MSRKVSDEFTVPVCRLHHRELHTHGDEKQWWKKINIDPLPIALRLWKEGRADRRPVRHSTTNDRRGIPDGTIIPSTGATRP
jgi:hypothetical protein